MKRILSAIICIALCMGMCAFPAAAEGTLQEKVDYITSLGIMRGYEDGSFRTDGLITRAEFAAVIVRLAGLDDSADQGLYDGRFTDVTAEHWAAGYIALAVNMGVVNGYTDKTFRPEDNVTYEEAVKMTVCMLGYGIEADRLGGWPTGYMAVATKLKILSFDHYTQNGAIDRGEVVRMLYEAIDAEIMITESINSYGNYVIGKGGTVLETLLSGKTKKGKVTATPLSSLHESETAKGHIAIDDTTYLTDLDCAAFLGERVEFVVTDTDLGEKVVYIKRDASVKSVSIKKEDIISVKSIFTSNGEIRYWNGAKSAQSIRFDSAVTVIFNNKVLPYTEAGAIDFEKDPELYTAVDNDNDGVYDLLKIKDYTEGYVKRTYTDGAKLKAATDSNALVTYDPDDDKLFTTTVLNGEIVPFSEIKEGDVISAAISLDKKATEVIISRTVIDGTVEATDDDPLDPALTVDGADYHMTDAFIAKGDIPALGASGKFYLTYDGRIAYFEGETNADGTYGFLTAVGAKGALNSECSVKILETNNTFSTYIIAKRVKLSDKGAESTKTASEIVALFKRDDDADGDGDDDEWFDQRTAKTQIIRYKLNADGEVNYIATAKDTPDENSFSIGAPNRKYFYSNSLFDQKWKATSNTVVFYIPSTKQGEVYTRYRAGTAPTYFSNGNSYQVQLYDIDKNGEIGAVFYSLTGQTKELTYSMDYAANKVMIVDKTVYTTDESGVERCTLSGMVDGEYTSVYVSSEFLSSATNRNMLKYGNVVQYKTDSDRVKAAYYTGEPEEIVKARLWCDFATTKMRKLYNGSRVEQRSPKITTVYGTVTKIDNSKVSIAIEGGEETDVFVADSQTVVKISADEKKLDAGTFYDIQPGKKIFVRMRYDRIKDVVICD